MWMSEIQTNLDFRYFNTSDTPRSLLLKSLSFKEKVNLVNVVFVWNPNC